MDQAPALLERSEQLSALVDAARELEVLGLLVDGLRNADTAERLFLSEKTVEHHISAILRKLGVRTRAEASVQAESLAVPRSPCRRSINMHIDLLAQILAVAVDHGRLESNPAVGKRRRLKASKPRPVHLDSAEQIALLLEAAGQLDRGEAVIDVSDRHGRAGRNARRSRRPAGGRRSPR